MQRSGRLRLTEVNQHLVCALCGGYFIDATTIVECLHSFCRSCLIKYLETNSFCPICDVQIHKAKPFLNIKPDKALQDIVYKLVPGLFHSEMRRRQEFYAKHPERMHETTPEGRGVGVERLIYSPDDSISLSLQYLDGEEEDAGCASNHSSESENDGGVAKRYLQCPALVTIGHLKKFLRIKYELTSGHTVEVIHRRESLPDDYTLMDVAYIYTWKRNGPMRFFFRITQSPPGSGVHLQEQTTNSGVSTVVTDTSEVSHSKPKSVINNDQDNSRILPQAEVQKSVVAEAKPSLELPRGSSTESTNIASLNEHPATVSTSQTAPVVVTKSIQSIPLAAAATSVSSAVTTCTVVSSSQSLQANSHPPASRTVTKPSSHTTAALTKTTTVTKTTPSLISSSVLNDGNVLTEKADSVTRIPVQQASATCNGASATKPVQIATNKQATKVSCPQTEHSVSKSMTKELPQASSTITSEIPPHPVSKEIAQKIESQISIQTSSSNKVHIPNGVSKSEKEPSSSNISSELNNCKAQTQEEKPIISNKTETEVVVSTSNKNAGINVDKNISITNTASGSSITTKEVLSKYVQQRIHNSGKKLSQPSKITAEASRAPYVSKNQIQPVKDTNKIRTHIKLSDKPAAGTDNLISKTEIPDVKPVISEKNANKERSNISASAQKAILSSDNTLHVSANNVSNSAGNNNNNSNKVPQQNQQIIRNNQQILKKNDEIMRCVPVKRPVQPIPRKAQDVLKNSIQNRDTDDKANAKKRRIAITNPIKRPALNTSNVAKADQSQPLAKKSRPITENNRKLLQPGQKTPQPKVRFPNPITGQNNGFPIIKSETNMDANSKSLKSSANNNNNTNSNTSMHLGSLEVKNRGANQENVKNRVISERVQPNTTIQRPPSTNPFNPNSKMPIVSTAPSPIKTEHHAAPPPVKGSPQNMTSPPVPVVAHANINSRLCPTPLPPNFKGKTGMESDGTGALDLSASPRRQPHPSILSIAQTLARRQQQQQCPSPAPPPLSPLSALSPFPVIPGVPVRSPPPQLRIPIPPHHRTSHVQQQRPSSLSSSSPSPPADTIPSSSRMGPPQQQQPPPPLPPEMYASHLMSPALMFRQQLELQRLLGAGKHNSPPGLEWYNDANSIKRFENLMKSLQQQQGAGRNSPFYPFTNNNNTAAAASNHRK